MRTFALLTSLLFTGIAAAPASAFDVVGVVGHAPPDAKAELRVKLPDGHWTHWRRAHVGEPVVARNATKAQLRTRAKGLRLRYIRVPTEPGAGATAARAARPKTLPLPATNVPAPRIVPRSAWDPQNRCRPRITPDLGNIQAAFVHHTVSLNGYAKSQSASMVLGICLFHRNGNGWNDMGYNFLVDRYGQVFEGRAGGIDEPVVGAQAGGFNTPSTGVSMIGNFERTPPPKAAMSSLAKLLAWKLSIHGVPATGRTKLVSAGGSFTRYPAGAAVTVNRISGHRDVDLTACPGAALYRQLPKLRTRVKKLEGAISRLSLATATPSATYGSTITASGTLSPAAGGETIEIRQLTAGKERVIASALTAPDGTWSANVPASSSGVLRAVYHGENTPGVISNVTYLLVTPLLTMSADTSQPGSIEVNGSVSPEKRLVKVTAYKGSRQVGSRRLTVADGSFSGTIAVKATPTRLVATVAADSITGAGRFTVKLPPSQQ